ncbi:itprip [Acrasis kona]|uniref:Itprip n=1 Tax=Acrasis kona TaxID=1008807 RepID=A0AAW2Z4E0_9EUKA
MQSIAESEENQPDPKEVARDLSRAQLVEAYFKENVFENDKNSAKKIVTKSELVQFLKLRDTTITNQKQFCMNHIIDQLLML